MKGIIRIFIIILSWISLTVSGEEKVPDCVCVTHNNGYSYEINVVLNKKVDELQKMFEAVMPEKTPVVYTKVPRGLIVTIEESVFFNNGTVKIKQSSLPILNAIASVLRKIDNECIIEGHNKDEDLSKMPHELNWELSLERSGNIMKYLVRYCQVPADNLFTLGFGEIAPFESNVSREHKINNRIDFIILDYEEER